MRGTRLSYVAAIAALCHILPSCVQGFMGQGLLKDPRLYNPRKTTEASQSVAPEPDLQPTGGVDPFDDTEKWFNAPDTNGDGTRPDEAGFAASEFDKIQITGWFSDKNVPTYTMTSADVWSGGDESRREYVHANAPNTEGQGWAINGVTYYQYRGINPGYAADGNYNKSLQSTGKGNPKLSRFYFYRFTGKGGGIQALDNNLIAVDTYSKLVFAFSEPVEFSSMGAPTKWSPTDAEPYIGQMYQFYQYDPVGYVLKQGDGSYEVVLYRWFQDNLAAGNYKAKIDAAYSAVASKTPDGAGKSPFNNHTVDFFKENMKLLAGATFCRRETLADGGNGLVLYKYTVDSDATKITRTATSWNGLPTGTSLDPVTYTIGEGESATRGALTDSEGKRLGFELTDETRTLTITGGAALEVAVRDFNDLGPDFIQRVAHDPTYKSADGSTTYTFSEKGRKLVLVIGGTTYNYKYVQPRNDEDRNCAVYGSDDAYLYYAGFQLSNQDNTIMASRTSGKWASTFVWDMTHEAHISYEAGATFRETVGGKSFSYRKTNDAGYDLSLMTLEFTADGSAATLSETRWGGVAVNAGGSLAVTDNGGATKGRLDDKDAVLTITSDGQWRLGYDGQVFILRYDDKGPSFVNRVREGNPTFVSSDSKTVYRFSSFGRTLRMTYTGGWLGMGNFDYTYEYVQEEPTESGSTSRAVYRAKDGISGFSYAGFELSNSDMQIKASRTSGAGAGAFVWDMTYDANRNGNTGSVPTEEDLDSFYSSIQGKAFKNRNVENGVAGLELHTWEFDASKGGALKRKLYPDDSESTAVTIPGGQLVATSKTSGTFLAGDKTRYNLSYDSEAGTILVETSGSSGSTSLTYYSNYDDKGPGFINRVKGKTYRKYASEGQVETEYKFSDDGKTLDLTYTGTLLWDSYGGKKATYTYNPDKEKGTSGKYTYAVYGNYYVDITDGTDGKKDAVIRMETTSAASNYWAAVMGYEATLVEQQ